MKKIYEAPATILVVTVTTIGLLAGSNPDSFDLPPQDDPGDPDAPSYSRRRSVWDDEDEDGEW